MKFKIGITAFFAFLMVFAQQLTAQIYNPVKWEFASKALANNEFELRFKATIEEHWHLYSQFLEEDGPIPTAFTINANADIELIGNVVEPKPIKQFDPNFQMDLKYFEHSVVFVQKVKLKNTKGTKVTGELTYMVCDESKCLPPDYVDFSFDLVPSAAKKSEPETTTKADAQKVATTETAPIASSNLIGSQPSTGLVNPVHWTFKVEKNGDAYIFKAEANIDAGWHLYSQLLPSGDGPVATQFQFDSEAFEISSMPKEVGDLLKEYDKNFDMTLNYFGGSVVFEMPFTAKEAGTKVFSGQVSFMACNAVTCTVPEDILFDIDLETGKALEGYVRSESGAESDEVIAADDATSEDNGDKKSLIAIFFIAFFSGFAALLTPCVFPMIPMTVSFFTKQSKTRAQGIRNAILYGVSIIVIYVLLGTIITAVFGSDALNDLSTNVWFNLFFFVLLIVFGVSFLGAFEITLPASWINKADQASDKGGLIGIFFMAFTLALVSFSCTGPIVGTLLVQSATIGGMGPLVGMTGFSLALALPFALFAAFPGWMNSLPKSGGWLNTVKVFLGFLEIAFAFKFLSNADLVVQAHYLERELFLSIWIGVFAILAVYLFGFIRFPHDSPLEHISVGRGMLGVIVAIFVIYLIPGLWGAPLKLISGFPPPMSYSESPSGLSKGGSTAAAAHGPEGSHLGPQNLYVFHDLEEAAAYAKSVNKPLFVDFTGHACVNCRKMEEQVWGEQGVIDKMRNDVVIASLYVDDKRELPADQQITVDFNGRPRKLKTIGTKWSHLQATKYLTNTQPYYVMLGPNGEDLSNGSADYEHHGSTEKFKSWLESGLELYKKAAKK